ncbi:MAG TPA: NAD(P)-binding domain-containing protein [Candidatus Corynebacterium avicola]|uniref:NAD(P)-binding domain-containing protein n=1 Tax=Candidatus Corynebacterium avicola TaxID=2838527 RepID=A0A9D1RSB5_9CORY|nr:NAD(P)-binding domain-containing protein [Candidatus Corynebacterium avicola]
MSIDQVGFIGVGSIAESMIEGLLHTAGDSEEKSAQAPRVILSPRSRTRTARLSEKYPQIDVVSSNADVVPGSDIVVLAVRPDQVEEALDGVELQPGQILLSVLAGVSIDRIRSALASEEAEKIEIVRSIPLPPVAEGDGVVPIVPGIPLVADFFDRMGKVLVVEDEKQLSVLSAATATCTGLLEYVSTVCDWTVDAGVDRSTAEPFVRAVVASLAPALLDSASSMDTVIASHETPGGLNEQLRTTFFDEGTTGELRSALDGVHLRAAGS